MVVSLWLMLLLGMSCGLSRWGSCLAAVTYSLNGFVMIHIPFGNHLTYTSIAWAPGLIWASLRAVQAPRLRGTDCVALALLVTLQLLCGHPQMAFYACFFTALFVAAAGCAIGRAALIRGLLAFGIGGLVAAGLCAFQLLPTLEYIPLSGRESPIRFDQATEFSFGGHRLISLLAGEYLGSHIWENHWDAFYYWSSAYGGAILPILAVIGAAWGRRSKNRHLWLGLALMGVVALAFACGRDNPVYRLVLTLPGFKYFRAPAKFLPWFILPVSLLGGCGLDWLVGHLKSLPERDRLTRHLSWLGVTVFGGLFGIFLVALFWGQQSAQNANVVQIAAGLVALGYILVASCWYLAARQIRSLRGPAFSAGVVLLLLVDLWLFGYKYIHACLGPPESVYRWLAAPSEAELLHRLGKKEGPFRVAMVGGVGYPNMAIPWHLRGLGGYDPISLRATTDLLAASEAWPPDKFVDSVELRRLDSCVYDLFDVHYILTPDEFLDPNLDPVARGQYLRIYRRKAAPRAIRWVSEDELTYRPPSAPPRTREELLHLRWDRIEIDAEPPEQIAEPARAESVERPRAEVSIWGEEEIIARYEAPLDGWLVLSLPWYPGWRAVIEGGASQPSVRAMHALTAFRVPAGKHDVRISYQPRSWRVGCVLSLGTFLLLTVWVAWVIVARRL